MTEREWREARDLRSPIVLIVLIVGAGAVVRFWALGQGIPYAVGVDEPEIVVRASHMMRTGDFNPHFFDYPGFYFYVQLVVACLRFLKGAMDGLWQSLDEVGPSDFYLWGRATTALFGTATVLLVYQIGMRWGTRHALLAAGLMAVMPPHVRESHYVLTDVPMTFFVTLTFLLTLRAHERGTPRMFATSGAAAGLAAATKYPGGLILLLPLLAAWLTPVGQPPRTRRLLLVTGSALAAFLIVAPYTLLDLPGFLNGFGGLAGAYRPRPPGGEPGWLTYLKHLRIALQWPALLLTFAGLALGLVRATAGPGRARWVLLVSFPIVYFYFIATKPLIFGRYLLPVLPFVCLLAATAVISGVSLLRRLNVPRAGRTALISAMTVAAVLPLARASIDFDIQLGKTWTQGLAYAWIVDQIPKGSRIAVETRGLLLPEEQYRVVHFPRLSAHEYRAYAERFDYLIASSQSFGPAFDTPEHHPVEYAAYQDLFGHATELATFRPSDEHPGPELRIYRLGGK